jgi:hypothetical protein
MFDKYLATPTDFKAITKALRFVMNPKMGFVFENRSKIANTAIVSYDSKFIYIWGVKPIKLNYKIPHNLKIPNEWQRGWWAGIVSKQIEKYLPDKTKNPIMSGGLLTPFIALQKAKNISDNPYTTKESYLATIIHEFGHIYFGGFGKEGELSAFCTEYYASQMFWPKHLKLMDKFDARFINLPKHSKEYIQNKKDPHIHAMILGRKIMANYPQGWPSKIHNYLSN